MTLFRVAVVAAAALLGGCPARRGEPQARPDVVPDAQDEEVWEREGYHKPGVRRERAPGQPATRPPPESILPPGGFAPPGEDPKAPVRPEEPQ